jgi:hypothetical protein
MSGEYRDRITIRAADRFGNHRESWGVDVQDGQDVVLPKSTNRCEDQSRIDLVDGRVADAQPVHGLRPEVVYQRIGAAHKLEESCVALGAL